MMKFLLIAMLLTYSSSISFADEELSITEVPRISAAVAYFKYKSGYVVFIDAMNPKAFAYKHILGAINIPNNGAKDIERLREMDLPFSPQQEVIVYCE